MDRGIGTERAWRIPYVISKEAGGREFSKFLRLGSGGIKQVFADEHLHVWNLKMSECFWSGIEKIHEEYGDDASKIWKNNPRSGAVVRRFLQFAGVGVKIASMATNILTRRFKIPMADRNCIDISPDTHVRRVFYRLGLVSSNENNYEELLYCARELNPEYPGLFDLPVWQLGKQVCSSQNPKCEKCYLNAYCPKIGVIKSN